MSAASVQATPTCVRVRCETMTTHFHRRDSGVSISIMGDGPVSSYLDLGIKLTAHDARAFALAMLAQADAWDAEHPTATTEAA